MCTLTLTWLDSGNIILVHNRDEHPMRLALPPKKDTTGKFTLWYPTDTKKSGTWCGYSSAGFGLFLLNGAFTRHTKKSQYIKSRGLVALELLKTDHGNLFEEISSYDFSGIEPFTMVVFKIITSKNSFKPKIMEYIWDGNRMHVDDVGRESRLWSSVTLYDVNDQERRQSLYREMVLSKGNNTIKNIELFHAYRGDLNFKEGINIRRIKVRTVSTTTLDLKTLQMNYIDYATLGNSFLEPLDLYLSEQLYSD